jgi:GGDEF domain-containing protein
MATNLQPIELSTATGRDPGAAPILVLTQPTGVGAAPRLMNWRGFHSELQRAAVAATQTAAPLSLLMVEIAAPESEVAVEPMAALAGVIEAVVGERALLARYSEGRIAVILAGTDLGAAVGRAERIAHRLAPSRHAAAGGVASEASAAIGVAQFQDDESLGHLIQRTAGALGRAMADRRPAVVADPGARQRSDRLGLETAAARPQA